MTLSFLVPNRTVLLVADEALYIYACGPKGPRLVGAVPWDSEDFEGHVAQTIAKDCGGKQVVILNDMVEQHYRKERIIRAGVGFFDKSGMLRQKVRVAFPNYPIRASLKLKEKAPTADRKGAADIYIFSAVPESRQITQTVAAINRSLVTIAGFGLLPVEASDMVKTLFAKLQKKNQKATQWVVFMGQHKHGGLRQIVIKNGELALTRMSPVRDSDQDAEGWAGEVYQEFNATMSYLTRFGFQPEDGLHVIAIANPASGEALQKQIDDVYSFSNLTTAEASRLLNLPLGVQDDYRHADSLHAGWVGRKAKLILPMRWMKIDRVSNPRKAAMAAALVLVCGILFLGYEFLNESFGVSGLYSETAEQSEKLTQLNVQYQKEVQRTKELGFDFQLVQSSLAVYDAVEKNNIRPLPLYRDVGKALGKDMRIDYITIEKPKEASSVPRPMFSPFGAEVLKTPVYQATMQMTYASTTNIDKGNKDVEDLSARLQKILTNNTIEITKRLKDYEYVQQMIIETGDFDKPAVSQDYTAEITIKGPPEQ